MDPAPALGHAAIIGQKENRVEQEERVPDGQSHKHARQIEDQDHSDSDEELDQQSTEELGVDKLDHVDRFLVGECALSVVEGQVQLFDGELRISEVLPQDIQHKLGVEADDGRLKRIDQKLIEARVLVVEVGEEGGRDVGIGHNQSIVGDPVLLEVALRSVLQVG